MMSIIKERERVRHYLAIYSIRCPHPMLKGNVRIPFVFSSLRRDLLDAHRPVGDIIDGIHRDQRRLRLEDLSAIVTTSEAGG